MTHLLCEIHPTTVHRPLPLELEQHHPVPRAWQMIWLPQKPPAPGEYEGQRLWDARVVRLPPTCHRNVHHWLVLVMHQLARLLDPRVTVSDDGRLLELAAEAIARLTGVRNYGRAGGTSPQAQELECAKLGPLRFMQAGGDIRRLIEVHAWGQA